MVFRRRRAAITAGMGAHSSASAWCVECTEASEVERSRREALRVAWMHAWLTEKAEEHHKSHKKDGVDPMALVPFPIELVGDIF